MNTIIEKGCYITDGFCITPYFFLDNRGYERFIYNLRVPTDMSLDVFDESQYKKYKLIYIDSLIERLKSSDFKYFMLNGSYENPFDLFYFVDRFELNFRSYTSFSPCFSYTDFVGGIEDVVETFIYRLYDDYTIDLMREEVNRLNAK